MAQQPKRGGKSARPIRREKTQGGEKESQVRKKSRAQKTGKTGGKKESRKEGAQALGRKAPLPKFVEPELCRIVAAPPGGEAWEHEVKFDGYRMQMRVEGGRARLLTRRGLDWTERFAGIARAGRVLADCLLDGEIVALDKEGVSDFARLQAAIGDGETGGLLYFVFDLLWSDGRDLRNEPLSARKDALRELLARQTGQFIRYVEHFTSSGHAMLEAACRMHLEGVVSKRLGAPYRSGRGDSWTKAKCRGGQEVVIGGWWGDEHTLRSLLVGAHRDGKFIYLGRVGTGFNAGNSKPLLTALGKRKRRTSPFDGPQAPPRQRGVTWVEPELVAEVEFGTITSAGLLRQASYKGLRQDKPAQSVVPEAQPNAWHEGKAELGKMATKKNAATKRTRDGNVVEGIAISHPDKALWPAKGKLPAITKLDLAHYYALVAPRILPHVESRPVSLVRAPDGIGGQKFFQRHAMKGGPHLRAMKVAREEEPYVAVEDKQTLVSLAQAAVLELHPWGAKKNEPEVPARIIFDLDPAPDVAFDAVIASAKDLRKRLEALGLAAFVKTTGGKGIHVVTPVKGSPKKPLTWAGAKAFAKAICVAMEEEEPDRYTTNMSKAKRGGKIFLDYLRNDETSTAVAPWSPRAREGATISMPLEWKDVKKGLDPKAFNIPAAAKLMRRSDPWAKLDAHARALAPAMRKLG